MSRIKTYLAYGWAFLAGPLVLAPFIGMVPLTEGLVRLTGLHVHPVYTGGGVARTLDPNDTHSPYLTEIHHPVFDGLVGLRSHGFIQIKWTPTGANLPALIEEPIDFDDDGTSDFQIRLNTKTNEASLDTADSRVLSVREVVPIENARVVRVNLQRR